MMGNPRYRGVIFDMDGTLTRPTLDFAEIRRKIGLPQGDIAHEIVKLPPARQRAAWQVIERYEARAEMDQTLQPGTAPLLQRCREAGIRLGIMTRNHSRSVIALCKRFNLTFDTVVTREFPHMKPHPGPALHILEQWALPAREVLVVGDYLHDLQCGEAAGTDTCFFRNPGYTDYSDCATYAVNSMSELAALIFPAHAE